jgi:hypothetical protein
MLITCSARQSDRGAHSKTMHLRCCIACPFRTSCGRAQSISSYTFAAVRSAARLVYPVAFPSQYLRRKSPTRPSSVSSGALSLPRCPTKLRGKLGEKALRGITVGYSPDAPVYNIYNHATRRITTCYTTCYTSVYVVFQEDVPGFPPSLTADPLIYDEADTDSDPGSTP